MNSVSPHIYQSFPNLVSATSTRQGGVSTGVFQSLNFSFAVGDDAQNVQENRVRFCRELGVPVARLVAGQQVHGNHIQVVTEQDAGKGALEWETAFPETDGIITNRKNLPLLVLGADCAPVSFFDPVKQVVGVVHAGWRGTVGGVVDRMVDTFVNEFGSQSEDILVHIGPCISVEKYEVGSDVLGELQRVFPEHFQDFLSEYKKEQGKAHLNLPAIILYQLQEKRVAKQNIEVSPYCTASQTDIFYSHRAEKGKTGRFGTVMMLR